MSEIPVTPEMVKAGSVAFIKSHGSLVAIYRAMRALEPPTCRGEPVETDPEILAYKVLRGGTQVNYVNERGRRLLPSISGPSCACGHPENAASCDRWECPFLPRRGACGG